MMIIEKTLLADENFLTQSFMLPLLVAGCIVLFQVFVLFFQIGRAHV